MKRYMRCVGSGRDRCSRCSSGASTGKSRLGSPQPRHWRRAVFNTINDRTCATRKSHLVLGCITLVVVAWHATARPASAQIDTLTSLFASAPACVPGEITVPIVEWDFQSIGDIEAGAITVDVDTSSSDPSRVWFVTRQVDARLFRVVPGRSRRDAPAQWKSWTLDPTAQPGGGTTGGLKKVKPSKDKRNVFVRTPASLQQVDTQCKPGMDSSCPDALTVFRDREPFLYTGASDIAIDDFQNVYTAAPDDLLLALNPFIAYIQKINPRTVRSATDEDRKRFGNPNLALVTTATRWIVGGEAGRCPSEVTPSEYGNCLAGVDVDEHDQHLVYFSAPGDNAIGELNTKIEYGDNVRLWSLAELAMKLGKEGEIFDPRQLKVEREHGKTVVWAVTGSGHVVRLIPQSGNIGLMSAHRMPAVVENDPFGVTPDGGVVGYTAVEDGLTLDRKDKVGMLLPEEQLVQVKAATRPAPKEFPVVPVDRMGTVTISNEANADRKIVRGRVAQNKQGDTFVDAFINRVVKPAGAVPSFRPMGITPDHGSKVGTFFYAVGAAGDPQDFGIIRIGRVVLPQVEKPKRARDDDDFDGDGKKNRHEDDDDDDDGTHNMFDRDNDNDCKDDAIDDDDDDNDGNEDKWDDNGKKETRNSSDHTTAAGGFTEHQVVVPAGSTLLVAQARATNATVPLRIEIFNPSGLKVASPLATPGVAVATVVPATSGIYKVRVTNLGLAAAALTTDLIVQELWPSLTPALP
jgi:hypothetical protein